MVKKNKKIWQGIAFIAMFFSSEGSSVGEKSHREGMPSSSESYSLTEFVTSQLNPKIDQLITKYILELEKHGIEIERSKLIFELINELKEIELKEIPEKNPPLTLEELITVKLFQLDPKRDQLIDYILELKKNGLENYNLEDPELRNKLREMGFSNEQIQNILSSIKKLKEEEKLEETKNKEKVDKIEEVTKENKEKVDKILEEATKEYNKKL